MSEMEQQRQEVTETSQPNRPFSVSLSNLPSRGPSNKTSFSLHPTSSSRSQKRRDVRDVHGYGDDGSDLEGEEERPIHEAVTGFDARAGGAIPADEATSDANGAKHELVIKVESKNNWRDRPGVNIYRPRSTKNLLPKEAQAQLLHANKGGQNSGAVKVEGPNMSYGLSFVQPQNIAAGEPTVPGEKQVNISDVPMADVDTKATSVTGAVAEQRPLTQDEIALQALNNESRGQTGGRRSDLIIESSKQTMFEDQYEVRYDEMSSFRADVATRPDSASLDDYTAIPVEEFGAALLRGMGWKEGQPIGRGKYGDALKNTQPRIPERRPGFLGIGAKDLSGSKGAEVEIGAWGKAAMRKSSGKNGDKDSGGNTDGIYMPVLMKSKKTGEFITEEEFKARRKEVKERNGEENWRERRDRNLEKSGRDWNRDRDYRRDNDRESEDDNDHYERSREGSSRRDRSRSSRGRNRLSRRRDDEDSSGRDDRHYREHERDRDRDRERDRDMRRIGDGDRSPERNYRNRPRFRDEDRDSRHSSSTPSRRDRDRDRDRRHQDGDRDRGHERGSHRRKDDYDR